MDYDRWKTGADEGGMSYSKHLEIMEDFRADTVFLVRDILSALQGNVAMTNEEFVDMIKDLEKHLGAKL